MQEEPVSPRSPDPFAEVIGNEAFGSMKRRADALRERLAGHTIWHVNSTSRGGGVAEMLAPLLAYDCGLGITNRWLVIDADEAFLDVTKKIHNRLHGAEDDGDLGSADTEIYERTLAREAEELTALVSSGDVVVLHDPQVAGLTGAAKDAGATVFWRSHIGADEANDVVRNAWTFLRPYIEHADGLIFSREAHVWDGLPHGTVGIIPPCIDAFSAKNKELTGEQVAAILTATSFIAGAGDGASDPPVTLKPHRRTGVPMDPEAPIVAQVGRWDRLKDPVGVIEGFAQHVAPHTDAHLVLSGPSADQVDDDPEGAEVMKEVIAAVKGLSGDLASRVHVIDIPLDDPDESALLVNAIQRRADVVVQKSLAEGFGLTVAEAMWKARPVVAGRVGGIQDQIDHGRTGLLVDDPTDLAAFGAAVTDLLSDDDEARAMGESARETVRDKFLVPSHVMNWYDLLERTPHRAQAKGPTCS
jgi:trehalose synthase